MGGKNKVKKDFPKINTNSHDAEISPPQTHIHIIGPGILVYYMMKFPVNVLDKIKT